MTETKLSILPEVKSLVALEKLNNAIHVAIENKFSLDEATKFNPKLKEYYPASLQTSLEAFEEADADRFVDKSFDIVGTIIKTLWKISIAVWKKLFALFGKLAKFIQYCKHRANRSRKVLSMGLSEGTKIYNFTAAYCDTMIKHGQTTDYKLVELVDLLVKSLSLQDKPLQPDSPISVRQWLTTIKNLTSTKPIKDLPYYIPEKDWNHYGFNNRLTVLSKDYTSMYIDLNNHYFKTTMFIRTYLNMDVIQQAVFEKLSGKMNLTKEMIYNEVLEKLLQPFLTIDQIGFTGNISSTQGLVASSTDPKSIFDRSVNKLNGFEAAILSLFPAFTPVNQGNMISYSDDYTTTVEDLVQYSLNLDKAINVITANGEHLFGQRSEHAKQPSMIPSENSVIRLLREMNQKNQINNFNDVSNAIVDIIRVSDKLANTASNYWEKLTMYQTTGINKQQELLSNCLPKL